MTRDDAKHMVSLTPTERIEWISQQPEVGLVSPKTDEILRVYERFLQTTSEDETELIRRFMDASEASRLIDEAKELGEAMYELLAALGNGSIFYRLLVV